jgi:GR25 family glycosyltransferase involved in LPS biosynthesis
MNTLDNIVCINLDSREDRWSECLKEFKNLNIESLVQRYPAVPSKIGILGCTMSHVNCIKIAKEKKYKNVLILEDDVVFNTDIFYDVLIKTFNQLDSNNLKYDMIYLGANLRGHDNKLIDKNLAKIVSAKTTHAYIINSSIYDYIIDAYSKIDWNDEYLWNHQNPNRMNIDTWYINNIQKRGNTYGTYPAIADQRPSYSDLTKQHSDYKLSANYNELLQKTTNSLTV